MRIFRSTHTRCCAMHRMLASTIPKYGVRLASLPVSNLNYATFEALFHLQEIIRTNLLAVYMDRITIIAILADRDWEHYIARRPMWHTFRIGHRTSCDGKPRRKSRPEFSLASQQLLNMTLGTFGMNNRKLQYWKSFIQFYEGNILDTYSVPIIRGEVKFQW